MKRASIVGLGNILKGDLGVACYVIEALEQERMGELIQLTYLADNPRHAGGLLYETDFAVIIGSFNMGGWTGSIHCWEYRTFRQNIHWIVNESKPIRFLMDALNRMELTKGFPKDLLFLWIEPGFTEGLGMSKEVCRAVRKTVRIIKRNLFERGFLPENPAVILPIYRFKLLRKAA
jgi:hydrogenase maturation protease